MPAPRPSESAEAARAAALQAEFNEKKWVWVPDEKEGYIAGWVVREDGEEGEVFMASGSEVCRLFRSWIVESYAHYGTFRREECRYTLFRR